MIVALLALGGLTAYKAGLARDPEKRTRTDVFTFLEAADAVASGTNPFGLREREHGYPYVYPPTPAVLFLPLRPLGRVGAAIAWYFLSVLVFGAGVVALRRALPASEDDARWESAPLLLVALPLASGLERGQLNPALAGLVALGAALLVKKRDALGGAALALSVAIKATPLLALSTLVKRPRGAGGAAAALLVALLLLPALFLGVHGAVRANVDFADHMGLRYLRDPGSQALTEGSRDYAVSERPVNQSLVAVLHRTRLGETAAFRPLALAVVVLVSLGALVPAIRLPRDPDPRRLVAAVGVAASATLLAAPIAWHWHHSVLYVPLVALGRSRLLIVFAVLELLHFSVEPLRAYGLLGLGTAAILAGCARVALAAEVRSSE